VFSDFRFDSGNAPKSAFAHFYRTILHGSSEGGAHFPKFSSSLALVISE
jgi:hypothetical protein